MDNIFFDTPQVILRTLIIAVLGYTSLILFLRISGKRTLSKMNAFDFIVTVALGSTLASLLLSKDVSLAQGCLALALLIVFQYLITWASVRVSWLRRIVTGEPALLVHEGRILEQALKRERVTYSEVAAAVRASGNADLRKIHAVVLETDGTFSVISGKNLNGSSVEGLDIPS